MAQTLSLTATKREVFGKKLKKLRKTGQIPANVYGSDVKSQAISVAYPDFKPVYKEAKETHVIDLNIEGETKKRPVLISQLQFHPVDRSLLHVDFRQVNLKEKIKAMVEISFTGSSPAVSLGAALVTLRDEVEVEALPTDLPDHLEVDLAALKEVGDTITIADLKVDTTKVTIVDDAEEVIVKAEEPRKEEESPAAAPAEGEAAPAEGEKKEEGEKKAEEKKE